MWHLKAPVPVPAVENMTCVVRIESIWWMVLKHITEIIPSNLRMKTNIIYFYSQLSKLHDQLIRVAFECVLEKNFNF